MFFNRIRRGRAVEADRASPTAKEKPSKQRKTKQELAAQADLRERRNRIYHAVREGANAVAHKFAAHNVPKDGNYDDNELYLLKYVEAHEFAANEAFLTLLDEVGLAAEAAAAKAAGYKTWSEFKEANDD